MAIENIVSSDNLDSLTKEFRSVEVQTDFEPHYSAFPPQRGNNGIIFKEKTGFSKSVSNFFSFGGGNKSTVPEENVSQVQDGRWVHEVFKSHMTGRLLRTLGACGVAAD